MIIDNIRSFLPLRVRGAKRRIQDHCERELGYPYQQVALCRSGQGVFFDDQGKKHILNPGDIFYFAANTKHEYYSTGGEWIISYIVFSYGQSIIPKSTMEAFGFVGNTFVYHKPQQANPEIFAELFDTAEEMENKHNAENELLRTSQMYKLLYALHCDILKVEETTKDMNMISPALELISKCYSWDLSLARMAEEANCSQVMLNELFKRIMGMTAVQYLLQYRIERAQYLLLSKPELTVDAVSKDIGFRDRIYFNSFFKEKTGLSPNKFRRTKTLADITLHYCISRYPEELVPLTAELPIYVTNVSRLDDQYPMSFDGTQNNWIYRYMICTNGSGILNDDKGNSYLIKKGMMFFVRPGYKHSYSAIEHPWSFQFVNFNGIELEATFDHLGCRQFEIIDYGKYKDFNFIKCVDDMYSVFYANTFEAEIKCSVLMYEFIIHSILCMIQQNHDILSKEKLRLAPVIEAIYLYHSQNLSIDELAEIINISKNHFRRLFSDVYGISPKRYLNFVRLEHSADLLLQRPTLSIKKIAEAVGFNNPSLFCAAFKKQFNMTPKNYRLSEYEALK